MQIHINTVLSNILSNSGELAKHFNNSSVVSINCFTCWKVVIFVVHIETVVISLTCLNVGITYSYSKIIYLVTEQLFLNSFSLQNSGTNTGAFNSNNVSGEKKVSNQYWQKLFNLRFERFNEIKMLQHRRVLFGQKKPSRERCRSLQ